jgi:hypothetical protein
MLYCTEVSPRSYALGQSLHFGDVRAVSAIHPIATKSRASRHFGFGQTRPRRVAAGAAGPHSIADTERPQNSARTSAVNAGRLRLCIWRAERPRSARLASHVDLLGYGESVINLNAKITNRALNLGMAEQKPNRP